MKAPISLAAAMLLPASLAAGADTAPSFADYPGGAAHNGANAAPLLTSAEARRFRTRIREGARERPDFDGHYIVATWGCGTDCEMGAIIDAMSGRVVMLPAVAGTPEGVDIEDGHFGYRLDSRLLVMNGMLGEQPPMGSHYFTFDGKRLSKVTTVVKPEKRWESEPAEKPQ